MIKRIVHGHCDFVYEESYDSVEKAAKGLGGIFVECKVKNIKTDFAKVLKEEKSENSTRTPEAKR